MNKLQWDEDLDDLLDNVGSPRGAAGPNQAHEGVQSLFANALATLAFALPDVEWRNRLRVGRVSP